MRIRRPLIFSATGFAAAVITGYYVTKPVLAAIVIGGLLAFFILLKQLETMEIARIKAIIVLLFFCAGSLCFCINDSRLNDGEKALSGLCYEKGTACVKGEIEDVETRLNSQGEKVTRVTLESPDGRVLVSFYDSDIQENKALIPGYRIAVTGQLKRPQGKRNPGCFDYSLYLRSIGISAVMTGKSLSARYDQPTTMKGRLFIMRENYIRKIAGNTDGDTAAFFRAIMFGDKGEMNQDILETFQRNGTAHILAVSGLHIGIIYGFLTLLWRWRKGWFFFCFTGVFFLFYAAMAGFSPSVVRAVLMILLHSFASITGRRYDLANAAFAVAVAVMIFNPFMVFNAGFQMSFLAVLTMALVLPFVERVYSGVLLSGIVIQIGLGPFMLFNFNYLSLTAVFINLPVIFLAGIIVPLGLVNMLPFAPGISFEAAGGFCRILQWINEIAEVDGVTTFQLASPPLWLIAFYYLGLLSMASEEGRLAIIRSGAKAVHIMKVCLLVLTVSLAFSFLADDGFRHCDMTFVDVGQGDCVHIRTGGRNYLADGGGSENYNVGKQVLRQYLLKNGVSHVDGAFVTHLHTDHYRGICELAQEGMIDRLYVYEGNRERVNLITKETGLDPEKIIFLHRGQKVTLGRAAFAEVLWPEKKTEAEYSRMLTDETDENSMSLIMKIEIEGIDALITGDVDEEGERELLSECSESLATDILKVAHHGSKYSSSDAFIDAADPQVAVIQVGENNMYGHPTPEVLQRLAAQGIPVFRNDRDGAVGFEIRAGEIRKVRKMIE